MRRKTNQSNPILWAFTLVFSAALAVIAIGGVRLLGPGEAQAAAIESTKEGIPPWPFVGPVVGPEPVAVQAALAALPSLEPDPTFTPTPLPTALATPIVEVPVVQPVATMPSIDAPLPASNVAPQPVQSTVQLTGLRHAWQTWNNCGPATLATNLSYYGSSLDQATIGGVLRKYGDDKNVSPEELVAYAQGQGYMAQLRVNGSSDLARTFLSNGIPLLIETWLEEEPGDGLGHYRLLVGYDDAQQSWIGYDSYVHTNLVSADPANYQGIYMPYGQTDDWWKVFNYTYVLVYPPDKDALVREILGAAYDPAVMWQEALANAQATVAANPADAFAHFNVGSSLMQMGDYVGAAAAFDQARNLGLPWRMLWYQFGPFAAYNQTGRYQEVIDLGQATLNSAGGGIEEIHYWRGQAFAGLGNSAGAQAEWNQALALNPDFAPAQQALGGVN